MRRFIYFFIPVVIAGFFVFIMLSDNIIKKNIIGTDKDIVQYMETIIQNIENEQWQEANGNIDKLHNAWRKVSKYLQFSVEKDQMDRLESSMARLRGAIYAKDKSSALLELFESKLHWFNIGR